MARYAVPTSPFTAQLIPGAVFATPFESGCIVLEAPDAHGHFEAADSEGVVCGYTVAMVTAVA